MDRVFSWDEAKREATIADRALDFGDADLFFDGRPVVHQMSPRNDEDRIKSTALIASRFFTIVWLERGEFTHIISMRRAHAKDIRTYRDLYGG